MLGIGLPTIIGGLTWSALLSLMGIGITLLYRTTKVPNFAHASFVTTGVYISFTLSLLGFHPYWGILAGFILTGLEALLLFYSILEPLRRRKSSIFILMIGTLAFDILFYGILNIYADYLQTVFKASARAVYLAPKDFFIMGIPGIMFTSLGMLVISVLGLYLLLNRTTVGIALKACMENTALAQTIGVNVSLMLMLSWFIAGGIAGIAGALLPMYIETSPDIGVLLVAEMFCVSILGGLEQIYGAPLGGFLMGFAEVVLTSWLASEVGPWIISYTPLLPLGAMALALIFIPKGLATIRIRRKGGE